MLSVIGHEQEARLACQCQVLGDCTIETRPSLPISPEPDAKGKFFWETPLPPTSEGGERATNGPRIRSLAGRISRARRPPAGQDRFDKLLGQSLVAHFLRQPTVIVFDGYELHAQVAARFQQRVPDVGMAVVLRPAQHSHVDEMPVSG